MIYAMKEPTTILEIVKTLVIYFLAIGGTILALGVIVWMIYRILVAAFYLTMYISHKSKRVTRLDYTQRGILIVMSIVIFIVVVLLL